MEYLIWFVAVLLASTGTYMGLSRTRGYPYTFRERHPWTVMTFFYGLALLAVVFGLDLKGIV